MRSISLILMSLAICLGLGGVARAGSLAAPGPNPNWTNMQKFEWHHRYMAQAANTCGTYNESAVLRQLARMTPYGDIGLGSVTGDGFAGPVCGRINNDVRELAADADKIRAYLEATYDCTAEECYGQKLNDWKFHACADRLKDYLAEHSLKESDVREITFTDVRHSGATLDYTARVRLKSCQGSLYVDMRDSCLIERDYTRGDCEVAGVDGF
jgi:hypothetical protein